MPSVTFLSFTQRNLFRAFQFRTMTGEVYRVDDPELIEITPGTATLLARVPGTGQTTPVAVINLASVTSLSFATPDPKTP